MEDAIDITDIARLLADSSRSTMLKALMDQRARTAGELARLAKIAPSTASQHLGRLTDGRLLVVEAQGRHRYYRLADPKVAALLENMMTFTPARRPPRTERRLRPALCPHLLRPPRRRRTRRAGASPRVSFTDTRRSGCGRAWLVF